jgi:hypothetical protein
MDIAWDLWELRNGALHHEDSHLPYEIQIQAIRDAFAGAAQHTPRNIRRFFGQGIQAVLHKHPTLRAVWLHNVNAALAAATTMDDNPERQIRRRQQQMM